MTTIAQADTDSRCSRRGRPQEMTVAEREAVILDAAETLLATNGIWATSMSDIAKQAGMSKRTLYQVFPSRAGLFEACIRRIRSTFFRALPVEFRDRPLAERLHRILSRDASVTDTRAAIAVLRAVILEAPSCPEIGQTFLREGPHHLRQLIRDELQQSVRQGEVRLDNIDIAAEVLCDMVFENPIERLITPNMTLRSPTEINQRLDFAITTFVQGIATPP